MSDTAERMSRVDNAWLRMDNDVNLMMIVGVWLLQPAVQPRGAVRAHRAAPAEVPALSPEGGGRRARRAWVEDEAFDIQRHVVRETLPRKRGQSERAALQARCGELATTRLDPAHPLWQFHLVEHYEGGSAHHRAHPPLHRRRHRADLGGAVHHRRRRPAAAAQRRRHDARRLAVRRGDQAAHRPGGQGHRPVRRRRGALDGPGGAPAGRHARAGAHRPARRHRPGGAGADGRRFADAAEGQAGGPQASSPGASRSRWTWSRAWARR